jgi:hypothetical protein
MKLDAIVRQTIYGFDTSISVREWGVKEQILILSKSPLVSLKLKGLNISSRFIFSQSPSESIKAFEIF